jgi:hypothetical protein
MVPISEAVDIMGALVKVDVLYFDVAQRHPYAKEVGGDLEPPVGRRHGIHWVMPSGMDICDLYYH